MRVPAADEMEPSRESLFDFRSLSLNVGRVGVAGPAIRSAWARRLDNFDGREVEACEQEASGLALPKSDLAVAVKVLKDGIADLQGLSGMADLERDHAARTFAVGSCPQRRSRIVPPSSAWGAI